MEKEILEILKAIQLDITGIKDEQLKVNEKLDRIENKIDITYDQVARSSEYITGIKNDLCFVEEATAKNWKDIAKLKAVKQNNEKNGILCILNEISLFLFLVEKFKFNFVIKLKNERGAGRKEIFTEEQKARVKMLRLQDKSYRAIAKDMKCSVATVHKIINEQQC